MQELSRYRRAACWSVVFLGCFAGISGARAQEAAEGVSNPFAVFEPLIGEWGLDPESEMIQAAPPERREQMRQMVGLAFAWGDDAMRSVEIREIYPDGSPRSAAGYGLAVWNPVDQQFHYVATNTQEGFFFEGSLVVLENGAIQRVYEVSYGSDRSQIPGDTEPGWTRRFRDTYTPDGDRMEQRVEIFWKGSWRAFGGGTGVYSLVRR